MQVLVRRGVVGLSRLVFRCPRMQNRKPFDPKHHIPNVFCHLEPDDLVVTRALMMLQRAGSFTVLSAFCFPGWGLGFEVWGLSFRARGYGLTRLLLHITDPKPKAPTP